MASGNDWLMRPVVRGMCTYADLKSGRIDLADVAEMNDAIDVADENSALVAEAEQRRRR